MRRIVSSQLHLTTTPGDLDSVFQIAVARRPGLQIDDQFTATVDGSPTDVEVVDTNDGGLLHVVTATGLDGGLPLEINYTATVDGVAEPGEPEIHDRIVYLRPSRYAESDVLLPTAGTEFANLAGKDLLDAITLWVNHQLVYVAGSSRPIDGAVDTMLARQGVCRDFAQLVVALLRARGVPARLAAVYAPGLTPMDFHAVAEAWIEDAWYVVDATGLAPRQTLLRIATGRDGADTAFESDYGAQPMLAGLEVSAVVEPELPSDDATLLTRLA